MLVASCARRLIARCLIGLQDEEGFAAAVKKDLVFQLGTTTDLSTEFIPDAFRRYAQIRSSKCCQQG